MNKRISLGAAIAFMIIVAAATFSMTMNYARDDFNQRVYSLREREDAIDKYAELQRIVSANYIGQINQGQLMDNMAKGYIAGIGDPYAEYISAEEYALRNTQSEDQDVGIGITVEVSPEGYLLVTEVYPDSPAYVAGIEEGDLIVRIDETRLSTDNAEAQRDALLGAQGSTVSLVIRKGGEEITLDNLVRRAVTASSVSSRILEDTNVGYIHIREFTTGTANQFNQELDRLLSADVSALAIDLRDNSGGGSVSMRQATRILDRLVPAGYIYTAQRKDGTWDEVTSDPNQLDLSMAVLVNAETTGAAELFAQVLRDYDKARIVGTTTKGMGVLQETIQLSDGSAVTLSVGYITTPSGIVYNGVGVKPDFETFQEGDWSELDEYSDSQLIKAIEVALALNPIQEEQTPAEESQPEESQPEESEAEESSQPEEESQPEESLQESADEREESSQGEGEESEGDSSEPEESL